jgi:cell division protein FtsL
MTQKQKHRLQFFSFPQKLFAARKFAVNWSLVNKGCGATIIILIIVYIVSINDLSIKSFTLQAAKNEIADLQKENDRLNLAVMNLDSYDNINRRAKELKMVKVDKIEYIEIKDGVVAKK